MELNPNYTEAYNNRGLLYREQGKLIDSYIMEINLAG
ncbi:tetratricopeptide repeat protein [Coleofasciculus chthonoplastes]